MPAGADLLLESADLPGFQQQHLHTPCPECQQPPHFRQQPQHPEALERWQLPVTASWPQASQAQGENELIWTTTNMAANQTRARWITRCLYMSATMTFITIRLGRFFVVCLAAT